MVTINPEIVQFIRHLALTGHLTVMYKDSTNIGVNLTKGESFLTPKRIHNLFFKMEFYEFVYVCSIYYFSIQTAKSDEEFVPIIV